MRFKTSSAFAFSLFAATLAGCGGGGEPAAEGGEPVALNKDAPAVKFVPESDMITVEGKPMSPISVAYRIIGTPIVGQPVAVDIKVDSSLGPQPINVRYQINDASAMQLAKSQPETIVYSPDASNDYAPRQVTIVPMREGRLYLNVSASIETETGSMSTVTAIPIQVGEGARQLEENGEVGTDENGEAIRTLPGSD